VREAWDLVSRFRFLALFAMSAALAVGPSVSFAQERAGTRGFSAEASAGQHEFEAALLRHIWPDTSARYATGLSSRPHVAGTPGQVVTRDSVMAWLRESGLEAGYDSLILYLPQPIHISVSRVSPDPMDLTVSEPPLPGLPPMDPPVPVFNAFSGNGVATGAVVYANYGLPDDYRILDSLGVTVQGRVVVARYGRSFRGIKAREAARRGASALLLYSDPSADGFGAGAVYPEGPFRPERGVQRGSILNANGDPSTPDGPSLPGAPRVPEDEMVGIGRIPVVPLGYGPAGELLGGLDGPEAPDEWQGGLPFTYRLGAGGLRARVEVRTERGGEAYHPAFNTIAVIRGSEWPDEWILVGGHRDAWGPGAIDDVSGTAGVIAAARAFGELAKKGMPPRRSVLFATWDAEEWGIIGSIEWVEANSERLRGSAVAYLNLDVGVSGNRFGASASPELKALIRESAAAVDEPDGERSVYDGWLEDARGRAPAGQTPPDVPAVGNMGGGSDHKGFYQHLGIPVAGFGFGGRGGVYHSMYDTPDWMQRFGDPGYRYHATVARILAVAASRLANADVLPFDYEEMAQIIADQVRRLQSEVSIAVRPFADSALSESFEVLNSAVEAFRSEAAVLKSATEERLADVKAIPPALTAQINRHLRQVGPALTSADGLPGDAWSRQLLFASDPDNGYSTLPLPAIRLALRAGDMEEVSTRVRELAGKLAAATAHLQAARRLEQQ
jgi:N-acetylated-alpha-linked acidic dipeptidase